MAKNTNNKLIEFPDPSGAKEATESGAIAELRLIIRDRLAECNSTATPTVCKEITDRPGYLRIEKLLIEIITRDNIGVGSAIAHLESELS